MASISKNNKTIPKMKSKKMHVIIHFNNNIHKASSRIKYTLPKHRRTKSFRHLDLPLAMRKREIKQQWQNNDYDKPMTMTKQWQWQTKNNDKPKTMTSQKQWQTKNYTNQTTKTTTTIA
jgi:hypothetical protein